MQFCTHQLQPYLWDVYEVHECIEKAYVDVRLFAFCISACVLALLILRFAKNGNLVAIPGTAERVI